MPAVEILAFAEALADQGLSVRRVSPTAVETPDRHRLTARGGRFWHRCPHGGRAALRARAAAEAAAEFAAAVQAERAMVVRLYVEAAAARAFAHPPPPPPPPPTGPAVTPNRSINALAAA